MWNRPHVVEITIVAFVAVCASVSLFVQRPALASSAGYENGASFTDQILYHFGNTKGAMYYTVVEDVTTGNLIYYTNGSYGISSFVVPYSQLSIKEIAKLHQLFGYVKPSY